MRWHKLHIRDLLLLLMSEKHLLLCLLILHLLKVNLLLLLLLHVLLMHHIVLLLPRWTLQEKLSMIGYHIKYGRKLYEHYVHFNAIF